jgi:hypothetical protein
MVMSKHSEPGFMRLVIPIGNICRDTPKNSVFENEPLQLLDMFLRPHGCDDIDEHESLYRIAMQTATDAIREFHEKTRNILTPFFPHETEEQAGRILLVLKWVAVVYVPMGDYDPDVPYSRYIRDPVSYRRYVFSAYSKPLDSPEDPTEPLYSHRNFRRTVMTNDEFPRIPQRPVPPASLWSNKAGYREVLTVLGFLRAEDTNPMTEYYLRMLDEYLEPSLITVIENTPEYMQSIEHRVHAAIARYCEETDIPAYRFDLTWIIATYVPVEHYPEWAGQPHQDISHSGLFARIAIDLRDNYE